MKYRLLGKSGLRVSEISLGAMTFGEDWGWGASKDECRQQFEVYTAGGGNFIDTANRYTDGTSEKICGELIAGNRGRYVLATKYTISMDDSDPNAGGNHRKNMVQAVEASLRRLDTDYIDLYWLHAWDFMTPIDEVMRGLDDLVRAGKVLYIGISDTPAWIVSRANTIAELRGLTQFVGLQIEYSLIERTVERELIPMANELDLAVAAWAPLGGGLLTGKYSKKDGEFRAEDSKRFNPESKRLTDRNLAIAAKVDEIAKARGVTSAQIANNWVRQQPGVVIPIVGARTVDQLKDSLGCLEFELRDDEMSQLDEVSRIELGFPHDFLQYDYIRKVLFGDNYDKIVNHRR